MHVDSGIERSKMDENSSMFWHKKISSHLHWKN
jgi:hypothetical protein